MCPEAPYKQFPSVRDTSCLTIRYVLPPCDRAGATSRVEQLLFSYHSRGTYDSIDLANTTTTQQFQDAVAARIPEKPRTEELEFLIESPISSGKGALDEETARLAAAHGAAHPAPAAPDSAAEESKASHAPGGEEEDARVVGVDAAAVTATRRLERMRFPKRNLSNWFSSWIHPGRANCRVLVLWKVK